MTGIRLEHITKRFGSTTVIDALDLTIGSGEFFTFVGPSGCGKSTVLNMIAGLEPATSGTILFDNAPVNALSPGERDVAMVFQGYALYPHMTVYDNIAFPLRMKKEDARTTDREVRRIAGLVGLGDLLERHPRELSGGQRQRTALGRAIVRKPRVFLMDEPLSNLDARLRVEMRGELKKLHRELGITTVYVTHDQSEAMGLSDRMAVLHAGVLQQCGTPREVYQRPANIFVAGFMGSPAMNLLPCPVTYQYPLIVDINGVHATLPAIVPSGSTSVIIGIRPEDVVIEGGPDGKGSEAVVSVIEPTGSYNWVDVLWKGTMIRGVAGPEEAIEPGGKARLSFPTENLSVFDRATGMRLPAKETR